jgi:hypothetical protein
LYAGEKKADAKDWMPLFNGMDLSNWVNVNCAPETFTVKEGMIYCTGKPAGFLRTNRQYENFILEMDWKHLKAKGNSGLFVWADALPARGVPYPRSIEVQIMDGIEKKDEKGRLLYTSQGDIFSIHGAKLKPDRPHPAGWERCLPNGEYTKPAGEWNHYRVTCINGTIKLAINGHEVSGASEVKPRKGYICLESEGSPILFKDLKIKVLKSSRLPDLPGGKLKEDEEASADEGFQSLYDGLDLHGWKEDSGLKGHWQPRDFVLHYDGKAEGKKKDLWTEKDFGDFILICDWRFPAKAVKKERPVIQSNGEEAIDDNGKPKTVEVLDAGDSGIYLRGTIKSQVNIWCWPVGSGEVWGDRTDKKMPADVRAAVTPKVRADNPPGQWNRFIITMKGDRLNVELNGKAVIAEARLPGVPLRGPIGLQHHGDPIEFANIFIRELKE